MSIMHYGSRGSHACTNTIKIVHTENKSNKRAQKEQSPWYTEGHVYQDKLAKYSVEYMKEKGAANGREEEGSTE